MPRILLADLLAAERVVAAGLTLLLAKARGGEVGEAVVSMRAAAEDGAEPLRHRLAGEGAVLGGAHDLYRLYRAADGWVALAALEPHFRTRLEAGMAELEEDEGDGARGDDGSLDADELAARFATRPAAWWEAWARERDLPLVAVRREG
jgi:crotonobetainyl-CoA:carnitine CoA-transferase CaiB-like acyl-CoA transferase